MASLPAMIILSQTPTDPTFVQNPYAFYHTARQHGDLVALLLGAANRDPSVWADPDRFDPTREIQTNTSFGGGLHFCVGAPLARLEMRIALPILFDRCPGLHLAEPPVYSNSYHFHGLRRLIVRV